MQQITPDYVAHSDFWLVVFNDPDRPPVTGKIEHYKKLFSDGVESEIRFDIVRLRPTQIPREAIDIFAVDVKRLTPVKYHVEHGGQHFVAATEKEVDFHNARMLNRFCKPYEISRKFDYDAMIKRVHFGVRMIVDVWVIPQGVIALTKEPAIYANYTTYAPHTSYIVATGDSNISHSTFQRALIEILSGCGVNQWHYMHAIDDLITAGQNRMRGKS